MFRLTNQRFQAYRRKARVVANSDGGWTGESVWKPSARERKKHPEWPAHTRLTVRIHSVRLPNGKALKVVTDAATASAKEVAQWYRQRTLVEVDIRNVKVVLNTERMAARSDSMFRKELLLSMVAYNLVIQFRRQAAERARCGPRELSFKRVWTTFQVFLLAKMFGEAEAWRAAYEQALGYAAKARLPKRPPGRQYEREAYPRRPEADQFKKRHPQPLAEDASE